MLSRMSQNCRVILSKIIAYTLSLIQFSHRDELFEHPDCILVFQMARNLPHHHTGSRIVQTVQKRVEVFP